MIKEFASRQWAALDKALLDAAAAHGISHYGISERWIGDAMIVHADRMDDDKPTVLCLHFGRYVGDLEVRPLKEVIKILKFESGAE